MQPMAPMAGLMTSSTVSPKMLTTHSRASARVSSDVSTISLHAGERCVHTSCCYPEASQQLVKPLLYTSRADKHIPACPSTASSGWAESNVSVENISLMLAFFWLYCFSTTVLHAGKKAATGSCHGPTAGLSLRGRASPKRTAQA